MKWGAECSDMGFLLIEEELIDPVMHCTEKK